MLKRRAVAAVAWSAVEQIGAQGISVLFTLVLAHILAPEAFGIFASATLVTAFLSRVAALGLESVLIQRKSIDDTALNTAFWMVLTIAMIFAVLAAVSAPLVALAFDFPGIATILPIVSVTIVFSACTSLMTARLRRELRIKELAKRTLVANIVSGCVAVPVAVLGYGVFALVVQHVLGSFLALLMILLIADWKARLVFDRKLAREMLHFGAPMLGADVITHYNRESPKLFVGLMLGAEALGLMTVALRILHLMINAVSTTITRAMFPIMSEINRTSGEVGGAYLRLVRLASSIIVPCFLLTALLREPLVFLLLGEQWSSVTPLLGILCVAGILTALSYINGSTMVAIGRPAARFQLSIIRAVVGTLLLALSTPWGVVAAAVSFLLRAMIVEPMQLLYILHKLGLTIGAYASHIRSSAIGAVALLTCGYLAWSLLSLGPLLEIFAVGGIAGAAYLISTWTADPYLRIEIGGLISSRRSI